MAWFAPNAPILYGVTLTTPAGLPAHRFLPDGREATSSAFLMHPGTDLLYPGLSRRTACALAISWRKRVHGAGVLSLRSSL